MLVVDDDHDVRQMLELFLTASGYGITTAANGLEGLARMRERRPCLVLLDLMMPLMSGWEFREQQLADPQLRQVPVACITAAYDPATVAERLGVPCVAKPLDFEQLIQLVHSACAPPTSR